MAAMDAQAPTGFSGEPSSEQVRELAKLLGRRWKDVARSLKPRKFDETEIDEISYGQQESITDKARSMLESWKREHGTKATIKCLYDSLVAAGCRLAAEKVFGSFDTKQIDSVLASNLAMDDGRLYHLAQEIGINWAQLGLHLGISEGQIEKIKCDIKTTDERSHRMLVDWYWENGSQADFNKVRRILENIRSKSKRQEEEEEEPVTGNKSKKNPQDVFDIVIKYGPDRWYDIGIKLGFTDGQVAETTQGIAGGGQKLNKIIKRKVAEVGAKATEKQLLKACQTIPSPIYGIVMDKLDD